MSELNIIIRRDSGEYAEELELAWEDWVKPVTASNGVEMPEVIWEQLVTGIQDGTIRELRIDSHPRAVMEHMAENGDWGSIESYSPRCFLWPMLRVAREMYAEEYTAGTINGRKKPNADDIEMFVRNNKTEVMERWGEFPVGRREFWYTDESSGYGIGICLSLGIE